MENQLWTRRDFNKAIVSLHALVSTGLLTLPVGCGESKPSGNPVLTPERQKLLTLLMDDIIPASSSMPSASQAGGVEYLTKLFGQEEWIAAGFDQLLDKLVRYNASLGHDPFESMPQDDRISVLRGFESDHPELFDTLRKFVYESYYINEDIWKRIGYEPYPTLAPGPKMDPFESAMLDQVRKRSPMYKDARDL